MDSLAQFTSSIRSSAIRAQWAVSAGTLIRLTGVFRARFSRHQARWGRSIRYMVAHMQTIGERKWICLVGVFLSQAIDQVELGADAPGRAGGGLFDGLDDEFGRADEVGGVDDLHHAFGMDEDLAAGEPLAEVLDVLGLEHLMDRAVASPEQDPAGGDRSRRVAAQGFARVPDGHLVERDAHGPGRVAAEVLIGEEEDAAAPWRTTIRARRGRWSWCRRCRRAGRRRP